MFPVSDGLLKVCGWVKMNLVPRCFFIFIRSLSDSAGVQHTAPMFVCLLEMKKPNRLTFPAGLDKFPVMCLFCQVGRPSENATAFFQTAFFTV